jgi:hypothetical protein
VFLQARAYPTSVCSFKLSHNYACSFKLECKPTTRKLIFEVTTDVLILSTLVKIAQMQNEWLQQRVGLLEKRAAHTGENIGLVSDEAFLGRHGSQPILPFNYHPNHSGFTSSLHASTTSCGHATCILVEASGIRRLMHKIRRVLNVGWGGKRTSVMSLPDFRRPWPVVLWLFAYASALHMIIAYLLHQMASSGTSLGHFW